MFWIVVVVGCFGIGVIIHPFAKVIAKFEPSVTVVTVLEINEAQRLHSILSCRQLALIDQTVTLVNIVMA